MRAGARIRYVWWLASTCLALVSLALPAQAEPAKRLGVYVEGSGADERREQIVALVPEGLDVIDDGALRAAMRAVGLPQQLGFALINQRVRGELSRAMATAIEQAGVDAVVLARVHPRGRGAELVALLYAAGTHEPIVDERAPLTSPEALPPDIAAALTAPLVALAPPPAELEQTPDSTEVDRQEIDQEPRASDASGPGYELFSVALGAEVGGRFFAYSDSPANSPNARPYEVFGLPAIAVAATLFPAATSGVPVLRDVGLFAEYAHYFGPGAEDERGRAFDTLWNRFVAGLRYRFRLSDGERPIVLSPFGAYGFQRFTFEPNDARAAAIAAEVADVDYEYLQAGLDARIPIAFMALLPSFAYVGPVSGGPVYDRFRDASLGGLEAGLDLAFVLPAGFELRAGASYTRFFSSFEPQPGDLYVAGGALDQIVAVSTGAAYLH